MDRRQFLIAGSSLAAAMPFAGSARAQSVVARAGTGVDTIDVPFSQFFNRPKQQDYDHVFAHGGRRQAERGHLMQFVVGGVVGEEDELRLRRAHAYCLGTLAFTLLM